MVSWTELNKNLPIMLDVRKTTVACLSCDALWFLNKVGLSCVLCVSFSCWLCFWKIFVNKIYKCVQLHLQHHFSKWEREREELAIIWCYFSGIFIKRDINSLLFLGVRLKFLIWKLFQLKAVQSLSSDNGLIIFVYLSSLPVAHLSDAPRRRLVATGDSARIQDETPSHGTSV